MVRKVAVDPVMAQRQTEESIVLDTGNPAPNFSVTVHDGSTFDLTAERGHWVLIWWYPKADTPG